MGFNGDAERAIKGIEGVVEECLQVDGRNNTNTTVSTHSDTGNEDAVMVEEEDEDLIVMNNTIASDVR